MVSEYINIGEYINKLQLGFINFPKLISKVMKTFKHFAIFNNLDFFSWIAKCCQQLSFWLYIENLFETNWNENISVVWFIVILIKFVTYVWPGLQCIAFNKPCFCIDCYTEIAIVIQNCTLILNLFLSDIISNVMLNCRTRDKDRQWLIDFFERGELLLTLAFNNNIRRPTTCSIIFILRFISANI